MGEIADWEIDQMMFDDFSSGRSNVGYRHQPIPNSYGNRPNKGARVRGRRVDSMNSNVNREVEKRFKSIPVDGGAYSIVIEHGTYRESIAMSFGRKKFVSRGFAKKTESFYNREGYHGVEVINMHNLMTNLVELLNNLFSADLMSENAYNLAMDAYEPFLEEALDYEEVEPYLEDSALNINKKKRISRRDKSGKSKSKAKD